MTQHDVVEDLGRLIRVTEARVSARITAALSIVDPRPDATEAEALMWREMESLEALRRQQWQMYAMRDL